MRREFEFINNKEEKVLVWASIQTHDKDHKTGLMSLWINHGYLNKFIEKTWSLELFVTDKDGRCWNRYNPQIGKDWKIDFNWILEATEENLEKLLEKVKELANA